MVRISSHSKSSNLSWTTRPLELQGGRCSRFTGCVARVCTHTHTHTHTHARAHTHAHDTRGCHHRPTHVQTHARAPHTPPAAAAIIAHHARARAHTHTHIHTLITPRNFRGLQSYRYRHAIVSLHSPTHARALIVATQALWQESDESVVIGTLRGSSLLTDEVKSGLNGMLTKEVCVCVRAPHALAHI